ncbi:hypothetical protein EDC56_3664 [Sinobacterium caligoides]|uniref:Uncharacterized protein n=1 Tax=Sinobacterium caligoides TaxID=933926 RepID=A0A3N2DDX3_9GAMM|nr:hypothetical protein [Sinobacterium caligoides]ROR97995.1 hypothetical protein EDC56_3664 [Sinobacterium caligoides]
MSNSIHMTIKQTVRESGYNYGSPEFKKYVFEHNIELLAEKSSLKNKIRQKRQTEKFNKNNGSST